MIFELNEEQLSIQKMVREFAQKRLAPESAKRDEESIFDRALVDEMGELGLNGLVYPEKWGGSDCDYLSYILAVEEISKVDSAMGITLSLNALVSYPLLTYGTEEQKEKYLRPLLEGKHVGAFCLTEPNAGSDAANQQTTATLNGSHYVLNGSKIFITNGEVADTFLVLARTDKTKGTKGISAFIMEKGMPGFVIGKKEHKMGLNSTPTNEISFQDAKVPKENLLGQEGEGFKIAMHNLDGGRIGVAAQALGIAQAALDHAIKYSKERVQFGKPISANQGISFMLADMATQVEAARLLVYRAAYLKQAGKPCGKEASMAKMYASDVAMKVTTDAVQIYGGYGYCKEYPVERLMRDAKITQIYEGANQIQRIVISGIVLK